MILSDRLENIRRQQDTYRANPTIQQTIQQLDVVAVIAITQAGKSALIDKLVHVYPTEYNAVISYTSRSRRSYETEHSMHFIHDIEHELDEVEKGNYIQYTVHPTKGDFYGTRLDCFSPHKLNLAPMLSGVVENLGHVGFKTLRVVAIIPDIEGWKTAFTAVGYDHDERIKRLCEARLSLEWCLTHAHELVWFQKDYGDLAVNAELFHKKLLEQPHFDPDATEATKALLDTIVAMERTA